MKIVAHWNFETFQLIELVFVNRRLMLAVMVMRGFTFQQRVFEDVHERVVFYVFCFRSFHRLCGCNKFYKL